MALLQEIISFLEEFHIKMKIWSILYRDDRGKNTQALADLELRPMDRTKILENLKTTDYCEGPLKETMYGGIDMWVFGREVKGQEVYIKITMGSSGNSVICISFHIADRKLTYPFK
jgi:hypothetical protein